MKKTYWCSKAKRGKRWRFIGADKRLDISLITWRHIENELVNNHGYRDRTLCNAYKIEKLGVLRAQRERAGREAADFFRLRFKKQKKRARQQAV